MWIDYNKLADWKLVREVVVGGLEWVYGGRGDTYAKSGVRFFCIHIRNVSGYLENGRGSASWQARDTSRCRQEGVKMNDLTMKRIAAFIIDYVILCVLASVAGTVGMIAAADRWMQDPVRYILWSMLSTFICIILLMWICFFIWDVCGKLDLGKRLMKIELLSNGQKFTVGMAIKHSVLKTLFCCIWPISFLYYILKHEMLYDRLLKISVSSLSEG